MTEALETVKVLIRQRASSSQNRDEINESAIRHCDLVKNRIFVEDRPFTIGKVFDAIASQDEIYASIQPLVKRFLEGYSCNVMAYGQSGAGKSFTMGLQSDNFNNPNRGIVPRALQEIMEFASNSHNEMTVDISFLEVYNEKVFDLLSDKPDEHINTKGSKITTGVKRQLKNLHDAKQALIDGNKNRRTRPTSMNTNSSRSHGIVVIHRRTSDSSSTFHMVDLAGSEGVRRTGHKGEALAEGSHINRGLLGIGSIFKALSDGSHVPYRDTVLGSVLQDSLNLKGFSTVVICISGMKNDVSETINSLAFAQRVMNMKTNPKIQYILPDNKKQSMKNDSINRSNRENFYTPMPMRRPLASSTVQRTKYRPNAHKITSEIQTPTELVNRSMNPQIFDLQSSRLMNSPTVKQSFDAMKRIFQDRNMQIKSINFSETVTPLILASDSDTDSELNSTVFHIAPIDPKEALAPVSIPSERVTKEECTIAHEKSRFVNCETPQLHQAHQDFDVDEHNPIELEPEKDDIHSKSGPVTDQTIPFEFKVPENPSVRVPMLKRLSVQLQQNAEAIIDTISTGRRRSVRNQKNAEQSVNETVFTDRRRSVRIQTNEDKRHSIVPKLPSPPPPKRRRTTISKKEHSKSGYILSKAEHCKNVLKLLNEGDMKAIQVLPQIGMKTAYCIITHRSLNGKFKSFKQIATAPFWRGNGWDRFEKANNLC